MVTVVWLCIKQPCVSLGWEKQRKRIGLLDGNRQLDEEAVLLLVRRIVEIGLPSTGRSRRLL